MQCPSIIAPAPIDSTVSPIDQIIRVPLSTRFCKWNVEALKLPPKLKLAGKETMQNIQPINLPLVQHSASYDVEINVSRLRLILGKGDGSMDISTDQIRLENLHQPIAIFLDESSDTCGNCARADIGSPLLACVLGVS